MPWLLLLSILALGLVTTTAIAKSDCGTTEAEIAELRKLLANDPTLQADSAITNGKPRLLGIAGYSLVVPGINDSNCPVERSRIQIMPATTDVICSSEHMQLIQKASSFATQYNARIIEKAKKAICER